MSLKDKLINNIVAPVASSHSAIFLDAVVKEINEKSNYCTISYTNENGVKVEQKNVPVQLQNECIIDWFPKVRDHVLITVKGNDIFITGPNYGGNFNRVKNKMILKQDILSDASTATLGGYIF